MTADVRFQCRTSAATADSEGNIRGSGEVRCQRSVGVVVDGKKILQRLVKLLRRGLTVEGGEPGSRLLLAKKESR